VNNDEEKNSVTLQIVLVIIVLLAVSILAGCSTMDLTEEQANKVIDARLQDGSDETCWRVMGMEVFCRIRTRDIDE
jgi:hypothetical protein